MHPCVPRRQRPFLSLRSVTGAAIVTLPFLLLCNQLALGVQVARCHLVLNQRAATKGSSDSSSSSNRPGMTLSLRCTSENPIAVGINSTLLEPSNVHVSGVLVDSHPSCQAPSGLLGTALSAALYFCGDYALHLINPVAQGAQHGFSSTGLLAFGNNVTVMIHNGSFVGNHGPVLLTMQHATVMVHDSLFRYNTAFAGAAALAADSSQLTLRNTTIEGGVALAPLSQHCCAAGGLLSLGSSTVTVLDSTLKDNVASMGGAIGTLHNSIVHIVNSSFTSNTVGQAGGALCVGNSSQIVIEASVFQKNVAKTAVVNGSGGAVFLYGDAHLVVSASTFRSNTAGRAGGVFRVDNASTITAVDCTFSDNSAAEGYGGVLYIGHSGLVVINDSNITSNSAVYGGAAFIEQNAIIIVSGSLLAHNKAEEDGGAIDAINGTVILNQSNISSNIARNHGGGIMAFQSSHLSITKARLVNNTAAVFGGGVYIIGSMQVFVEDTYWLGNKAEYGGALACGGTSTTHVARSSFANNNATTSGGAVVASSFAKVLMEDSTITNNSALYGGAAFIGRNAAINVSGSALAHNTALYGGAIDANNGTTTVTNTSFAGNKAVNGGAMRVDKNATATLVGSHIDGNFASSYGGGVYAQQSCRVFVEETDWLGNTAESGGALACDDNSDAHITTNRFANNNASVSGGAVFVDKHAKVLMNDSFCSNNSANNGGCIGAESAATVALLGNTVLQYNTAYKGGGLQLLNDSKLVSSKTIRIEHNQAGFLHSSSPVEHTGGAGGGVYLVTQHFDPWLMLLVHDNSAALSNNIAVSATSIGIIGNTSVYDFASRLGTDEGLLQVQLNVSGKYGWPCEAVQLTAALNDTQLPGSNTSDSSGLVHMHLKVQKPPGLYLVRFSAPEFPEIPAAELTLHIRSCRQGEVTPSDSKDACLLCPAGYFSFDVTKKTCDVCPVGADCSGSAIIPALGMWSSTANSDQVHRCPNPSGCQGNRSAVKACAESPVCRSTSQFANLQCSHQYYGNLCGKCLDGHGLTKPFHCRLCFKQEVIIGLYVAAGFVMLCIIQLMCHFTKAANRSSRPAGVGRQLLPADLFKPLLLYFQWQLVVVGSMGVDWRAPLDWAITVLGWAWSPVSPLTLSIQCLLDKSSGWSVAAKAGLIYLCMPVAMLLLSLVIDIVVWVAFSQHRVRNQYPHGAGPVSVLVELLLANAMVAWFFFLPSIVRTIFSMFACISIDSEVSPPLSAAAVGLFWTSDVSIQCFTGTHKAWAFGLGLPLIAIVCVGLPAFIFYKTLHNRHRLDDADFRSQWGFLTRSFKARYCYFEAVHVVETTALVAIGVFGVNLGRYYQGIVLTFTLYIIALLLAWLRPYAHKVVNVVAMQAACCLLFTSNVSMTLLPLPEGMSPGSVYTTVIGVLLLLVNLAFIISTVWRLVRVVDWAKVQQSMRCVRVQQAGHPARTGRQSNQQQVLPAAVQTPSLPAAIHVQVDKL